MARCCPILHLNGYKIANPTILARIPPEELDMLMRGLGWTPHVVEGDDPETMHPNGRGAGGLRARDPRDSGEGAQRRPRDRR